MKSSGSYIFDTNVLVSALLSKDSKPGEAFYTALDRGEILLSLPVVEELNEVLSREKFKPFISMEERESFLGVLLREATLVEITESISICRDAKDDKLLELAVSGGATCIITGDEDLLIMSPFRGIPIMKPEQFVTSVASQPEEENTTD